MIHICLLRISLIYHASDIAFLNRPVECILGISACRIMGYPNLSIGAYRERSLSYILHYLFVIFELDRFPLCWYKYAIMCVYT